MGDSTMNYSLNPQYKYSNKELQPELDLDTYDFGARHYDAVLGRWMGVDKLNELSVDVTPYGYAENNPMNMLQNYHLNGFLRTISPNNKSNF